MKSEKAKRLLAEALDPASDPHSSLSLLESAGVAYTFSQQFTERVMDQVFNQIVYRQTEFLRTLNNVFTRVAFAGVAAILLLLVSIFFMEGSLTFNSLVGISESFDENLISLLAGE